MNYYITENRLKEERKEKKEKLEEDRKQSLLNIQLGIREEVHSKIQPALVKVENYLMQFYGQGNEFIQAKKLEEFEISIEVKELRSLIQSYEIWLHDDLIKGLKEFLGRINELFLLISGYKETDPMNIECNKDVVDMRIHELFCIIEEFKAHIKYLSGGNALDNYLYEVVEKERFSKKQ
ncbi:hypothetical protein GCM10010912_52130 [Paenibacillus albidus]|uniref:Uncharacterized protein n=1 Tax=Paenibacillus albidus TaxID=2041023 RepID=A0A917CWM1_9BACL|nr:hypothetical protein [Paenibacillus albidus]GGG00861.1 hypothetical protein GCM10010912_52130 [Paenibacillus albidus]